jgi:hypothetical protein
MRGNDEKKILGLQLRLGVAGHKRPQRRIWEERCNTNVGKKKFVIRILNVI